MESYIVSQSVPNISDVIRDTRNNASDATSKEYLDGILALPLEEQEKWFLSEELAETIAKEVVGRPILPEICFAIVVICVVVERVVSVWNAEKKTWEQKKVKTNECKKKKVQTTCPK